MNDILDLPNWTVLAKRLDETEYEIEAAYSVYPDACPRCGVIGRLYKHGGRDITYRDSPIRGHTVRILAKLQRYRCRDCNETFLQPVTGVQEDMRMTERCAAFIGRQCLLNTFVHIADTIGCDEKTVRALASSRITAIDDGYQPALPEWLGIDETQIDGKMRCVITDIGKRRPIEMLADRDKLTLAGWLHRFKDRSMVKGIAIDMWRPYRDVAGQMFPGVPVVIDKFHVVRMANYCMERTRIRLGKTQAKGVRREWMRTRALLNKRPKNLSEKQQFALGMWLDNDPEMAASYRLKEAFYEVYDLPKADAVNAYDAWAATVPATVKADWKVLLTATKNWRPEILAYFDHPITNAYTEALNGVAKQINRAGRGYSYGVLRARILFASAGLKLPPGHPKAPLKPHKPLGIPNPDKVAECQSCMGLFDTRALELAELGAVVAGERRKQALMCRDCRRRFHQE